jgi:hypothetical protein
MGVDYGLRAYTVQTCRTTSFLTNIFFVFVVIIYSFIYMLQIVCGHLTHHVSHSHGKVIFYFDLCTGVGRCWVTNALRWCGK